MEAGGDSSLFLAGLLEELDGRPDPGSSPDLCRALCARLGLAQLGRLRSALLRAACLDPHFPATLFRDRAKGAAGDPQAQKVTVAADIATIFSLIQMSGAAGEKPPACPCCRPAAPGCGPGQRHLGPACPAQGGPDCLPFAPAAPPAFLPAGHGAPLGAASPRPCEMQRTCFPTRPEPAPPGPAPTEPALAGQGPFAAQPCVRKRGVFREDPQHLPAVSPGRGGPAAQAEAAGGNPRSREDTHRAPLFNHSFELPPQGPSPPPATPGARRAKHESLGDLQASTYFGPAAALAGLDARRCPGRPGRPTPWPAKSWSLNTEEVPDFERPLFSRTPSEERLQYPDPGGPAPGFPAAERRPAYLGPGAPLPGHPTGLAAEADRPASEGPGTLEPARTLRARGAGRAGGLPGSDTSSVGTQTELRAPDPLSRGPRPPGAAGRGRRPSDEDSEAVSDISDLFRFLDDVSVGGSTGLVPSSCDNSTASLPQLAGSDGGSSPERGPAPHGPPCGGGELRTGVYRLLLRLGEVERKLESLSGVRDELAQVLGQLSRLDRRLRQPEQAGRPLDLHSPSSEAPSDESESPRGRPGRGPAPGPAPHSRGSWCCAEAGGGRGRSGCEGARGQGRSDGAGRTLAAEGSVTSAPAWRTCAHDPCHGPGEGAQGRAPGEGQDWPRKPKEAGRQHRPPRPPRDGFLVEQVFSPQLYPVPPKASLKGSPLYTDMRLTETKRGQPPWVTEQLSRNAGDKGKLGTLDLQTPESLNPNSLECWAEDAHAPGLPSLLQRKEAESRRARVCKMAALTAAAACTVILVIVVPICTMKS